MHPPAALYLLLCAILAAPLFTASAEGGAPDTAALDPLVDFLEALSQPASCGSAAAPACDAKCPSKDIKRGFVTLKNVPHKCVPKTDNSGCECVVGIQLPF